MPLAMTLQKVLGDGTCVHDIGGLCMCLILNFVVFSK